MVLKAFLGFSVLFATIPMSVFAIQWMDARQLVEMSRNGSLWAINLTTGFIGGTVAPFTKVAGELVWNGSNWAFETAKGAAGANDVVELHNNVGHAMVGLSGAALEKVLLPTTRLAGNLIWNGSSWTWETTKVLSGAENLAQLFNKGATGAVNMTANGLQNYGIPGVELAGNLAIRGGRLVFESSRGIDLLGAMRQVYSSPIVQEQIPHLFKTKVLPISRSAVMTLFKASYEHGLKPAYFKATDMLRGGQSSAEQGGNGQ